MSMRTQLYHHIYADSNILAGQPCVEGTRIPASALIAQVAAGKALADVAREFQVSLVAVRAALEFAAECASQAPSLDDPLFELAGILPDRDAPAHESRGASAHGTSRDDHATDR